MDPARAAAYPSFPGLTTERLVLREITADDAPFWLRNFSAPGVAEMTAYEPPADLEAAKAEIERFCARPFREGVGLRWGIAVKGSDALVGSLGYHDWVREGDRRARIGYDLLEEQRGKGIMTEAMRIVLAYGFKTMTLNRVEALVDPRNAPSIRLLERLGFQRDAYLRQATWFRSGFVDDVVFSLLSREWRAAPPANR